MKGKKIDADFLSQFISQCVSMNKYTTEDMLIEAKKRISEIDNKIIEVEKLKKQRSKLCDVVFTFEKPQKNTRSGEAKLLSLFQIPNPHICKKICIKIEKQSLHIEEVKKIDESIFDITFTVKQLIENKVISRAGDFLVKGNMFDEYYQTVIFGVK